MKRILFLILLIGVGLHGTEINECKVDLYYANGIMMQDDEDQAKSDWQDRVDDLLSKHSTILLHIGNVDVAYNISKGMAEDLWESFKQRVDLDPTLKMTWRVFKETLSRFPPTKAVAWMIKAGEVASYKIHDGTLNTHIAKYKESIRSGHGVVVVAHSQGNLFVHEAYNQLVSGSPGGWMGQYFHTIAVATPDTEIINGGRGVSFTNDIITSVGMSGNLTNPNKHDRVYFPRNALGEINGPRTLERDIKSIQYHGFAYYLGYPVFEEMLYSGSTGADAITRKMEVETDVAKDKIEKWIVEEIDDHLKRDSQWTVGGGKKKKKKKCKLKNCKSKRERLTHRFDPRHMDAMLNGALVLPFDDDGKVYPVGGAYVKASCGGTSVTENPEEGICFRLEGTGETIEGEDGGPSNLSIKKSIHPVSTTLSWDKASDVAMSVSMSKNPGGPPKVGDVYKMNASGGLRGGSQITAECLQDDPIHIIAKVNTPNDWGLSQYEITDPGQLDLKTYGIVVVEERGESRYHPVDYNGSDSGDYTLAPHRDYTPKRKYDKCQEKKNKKSCGCVPCQFMVYGMQKTSQYGPIAEGDVTIIPAEDNNKANPQILYHTETTADRDTLKTGIINIDQDSLNRFDDDRYYIVRVQGGVDVDSDDDFIYDDMPTRNHGTIHAIVKGRDLKKMPFVVNVLTEAIYQVSGDMLGEMYEGSELSDALDERATKLINTKLDITSTHKEIDYKDVLLWTPAADKYTLFKPYETYVQPIVEKTYSNAPRADESYELIYGEYNTSMPILTPLSLEIQVGLPNHTPIAKVSVQNDKNYAHIEIDGTFADAFVIGDDGLIRIARTDTITEGGYYDLRMRAVDENGSRGSWAGLLIRVNGEANVSNGAPILQTVETYPLHENAPGGTKVAQVVYTGGATHYHLVGTDRAKFSIENSGTIRVANGADIDYESSSSYTIGIVATNDQGVSSTPFEVKFPVMNEMDTPALPVQITKTIRENVPIGTEVATIDVLREGKSPIESFKILNPRMPFGIDKTGSIYTTEPIDYEETKSYTFMVIATTKNGNSNKTKCTVIVKDVEPEPPKTLIDDAVFSVNENITAGSRIGSLGVHIQRHPVQKIILSGKDAYAFRVDANGTLYLSDHIGLDYERQRRFVFGAKALDETGYGKEAKIVIEVVNVPDTPPSIRGFSVKLNENHTYSAKAVVGVLEIRDPGEGNITDYNLSGADSELFDVDTNGTVMFKGDTRFDYETKSQYQFSATAVSTSGVSKPATITINIADAIDTPPVILESRLSIEENASKGTKIGTIEVPPVYKKDINYTIAKDPLHALSIDHNGTVYLAKEGVLDYEKNTSYEFEVTATNLFGRSDPKKQTIRIINTGTVPTLKSTTLLVPFDKDPVSGLEIGALNIDNGDGAVSSVVFDGIGSEYFAISSEGNVTLKEQIDLSAKRTFEFEAKAGNEFGVSAPAKVSIDFEPKPKIQAGSDMAVYANKAFSLHGKVDEAYRDRIKEIRWSSPQTDKINCIETNVTTCEVADGLLLGEYEAILTVIYQSGWQQSDSLKITVEPDPLDNVLSVIEKPLKGLRSMKLSRDKTKIYAVGDFEGDDLLKIIDVSDPANMRIIASFAYGDNLQGTDISLNSDETKAAIVASGHIIVVDISDPTTVSAIASKYEYWHQYAYGVEWYRDNQIIINNWDNSGDHMDAVIVDADTMDVNQTIRLKDGWIKKIDVIADKSLLIYTDDSVMKIYDINQSKIVYEGNNTYSGVVVDANATHVIYRGSKPVYQPQGGSYLMTDYLGFLDISDTNNISEKEIGDDLLNMGWHGDEPYHADSQSISLFSRGSSDSYSVIKELKIHDREKAYIGHVLQIRKDIENITEDKVNHVVYVYSSDGLKSISRLKQNSKAKFVYKIKDVYWHQPIESDGNFLYQSYEISNISNIYKPYKVGTFDIRKSCYPNCGIENLPLLGINNIKVVDDQIYIVSPGSPIDYWVLDMSDKNQTISLQVPQKYDHDWYLGNDFVMSSDKRYIYTAYTEHEIDQGLSVLDTETKQQNDFGFDESNYLTFGKLVMSQDEKYLYALFGGDLYAFDIRGRMNIDFLMEIRGSKIRSFVLSKKHNKIYAFSDTAIEIYSLETNGTLRQRENIPLQLTVLNSWYQTISLSPDERKIAISTKYGLRVYQIDDNGLLNRDDYVSINYPDTSVAIPRIIWINNSTFVAGEYIVTLEK